MPQRKLLIATTNPGKVKEIKEFVETLPFEIVSLNDIVPAVKAPEETAGTVEGNAILKAKYYAEKTGLLSLADDGGLFISAVDGWPGAEAAHLGKINEERQQAILDKLEGIAKEKRDAVFTAAMALFDPLDQKLFVGYGETKGEILEDRRGQEGFCFDPLFYVPELQKTYAEMTVTEKNGISHRGKAMLKVKYHLQNTYSGKHLVVPFALILNDGKVLMQKRNDPHRPKYHGKWEFPGGSVEFGEDLHGNVTREVEEETGLKVEVVKMINYIGVEFREYPSWKYQIYLIPFVCRVIGGDINIRDEEVMEIRWFDIDDVLNQDLIGDNKLTYIQLLDELKQTVC